MAPRARARASSAGATREGGAVNVRIPDTPIRLLALIDSFTQLRDDAVQRGEPWPASLDE
jgi:hypothetical protein